MLASTLGPSLREAKAYELLEHIIRAMVQGKHKWELTLSQSSLAAAQLDGQSRRVYIAV